jgi:hypothetical protein
VGGGFAREVSGIKLLDGGVEVVHVEHDACHEPSVDAEFEDVEID